MKKRIHQLAGLCWVLFFSTSYIHIKPCRAAEAKVTVEVGLPGHPISPTLFGIFFEDINLSADGGIYPELVRNRSFEDSDTLQNWKFVSADGKSTASISKADVQAGPLSGLGRAIVLSSASPLDENTLEEPTRVSPKTETVKFSGNTLKHTFPGNSFTVIRIPVSGEKKK